MKSSSINLANRLTRLLVTFLLLAPSMAGAARKRMSFNEQISVIRDIKEYRSSRQLYLHNLAALEVEDTKAVQWLQGAPNVVKQINGARHGANLRTKLP